MTVALDLGIPATRQWMELNQLLDAAEPRIRRRFLQLLAQSRDMVTIEEIATLVEAGQYLEAMSVMENVAPGLHNSLVEVYAQAGLNAALFITETAKTPVEFTLLSDEAVNTLRTHRMRLVREITQQTQAAMVETAQAAIAEGAHPYETARRIKNGLGLTQHQAQSVNNYRSLLERGSKSALQRELRDRRFDRTVERAIRERRPLTSEQVNRMVARYEQRMIQHRAKTIALTESQSMLHEGEEEMFEQAVREKKIQRKQVLRTWRTAGDMRVRDSHAPMNGQQRFMGDLFVTGAGRYVRWPGDVNAPASERINCRCVLQRRVLRG